MNYQMRLQKQPFSMIKNGEKTIELRLNDEKRRQFCVGDILRFSCVDEQDEITCEIVALHPFSCFAELYEKLDLTKCGYTAKNVRDADALDMRAYYSEQEERKYGVLGIEIKRV